MFFAEYTEKDAGLTRNVKKSTPIVCSNCGRSLGTIIESEDPGDNTSHTFICPCGSKSFTIKTQNKSHVLTEPDLHVSDIKSERGVILRFIYSLEYHGK